MRTQPSLVDQLAGGIFYHARELNDAFTSVFT
jgi:hypothetical protein